MADDMRQQMQDGLEGRLKDQEAKTQGGADDKLREILPKVRLLPEAVPCPPCVSLVSWFMAYGVGF